MTLYSDPPSLHEFRQDKPTLLVCWWATMFCSLMIILRIIGRFIRTERLFTEDKIAAFALVPMFLRMGCVHFILISGTNNADFSGVTLSDRDLHRKSIASGLVLASRVLYAATIWILKGAVLEFLRRLTGLTWERSHQAALVAIRWTLVITFLAVVVSGLTECRPFNHYWQVLPDPGGQCRQGYVQLVTMATCDVMTDLMLVIFPVSIIIRSNMTLRRKIQLVLLFSLSLSAVCVTLYRVPHILQEHGRQQYRSLLASVELIFATASANSLVLGSFVRDRGLKKQKFRRTSTAAESFDRTSTNPRRPHLHRHWGSDEDLVRDIGLGVEPELQEQLKRPSSNQYTPAPVVARLSPDSGHWDTVQRLPSHADVSEETLLTRQDSYPLPPRKLSFFDVGGLLESSVGTSSGSYRRSSHTSSTIDPNSPNALPPISLTASASGQRRGSTALLQDLGGLLGPLNTRSSRSKPKHGTELQPIPQARQDYSSSHNGKSELVLMDPGGLLK